MSSSEEDDSDDDMYAKPCFVSTTAVGQPFCRFQGAYLSNLLKLLDESHQMQVDGVIRWHPKIANALQINWKALHTDFDSVHPVLVQYKISRLSNQRGCVRPTMNRKLREWNFKMVCDGTPWVSYIYESAAFKKGGEYYDLPVARRRR